jgi:hypothetical protein
MTVNTRVIVSPPRKEALEYGLLSVVENRANTDPHWQNGVTWQNVCPDNGSTYEACLLGNALGQPVTGIPAPVTKTATSVRSIWGATPFTVTQRIDCSPPGFYADADDFVKTAFDQTEEVAVAEVFFAGTVGTRPNIQFPHLASAGTVVDSIPGGATLQLTTANIGPTGGGSLDIVEALGRLEQALGACVHGKGIIHVSAELVPHLRANHLITEEDGVLYTYNGNKVAASPGYSGADRTNTVQVGVSWMYGTGPVFMYKSRARFVGTEAESLNRSVDTLQRLYERNYVIGYDCCLFAVPVSTGGVVTGAINAAT